jgi:uncharacterized protein (TIGR00661 family)
MKILYGVPSEGMGHATRSKVIITHLAKNHDVRIVTSGKAFDFLNAAFPGQVYSIQGFHLAYKNAQVNKTLTLLQTIRTAPKAISVNWQQYNVIEGSFLPDLVISDFESFTHFFAKNKKLPLLSIDNIQVIDRCGLNIPIPASEKNNFAIAKLITSAKVTHANHYLISTFFDAPIKKKNTSFIPPIIRKEIIDKTPTIKNHIVVYQTSSSQKNLIPILNKIEQEHFIVYGFNCEETIGNVILKKFSEQEFISNLSTCKAVLCNGGYSFISEAIYLQKPICSIPIANQFEQFVNASYIDKLGLGRHFNQFNTDNIKSFLYDLPKFVAALKAQKPITYHALFNTIDHTIKQLVANK